MTGWLNIKERLHDKTSKNRMLLDVSGSQDGIIYKKIQQNYILIRLNKR
jgi:hypothetical protein